MTSPDHDHPASALTSDCRAFLRSGLAEAGPHREHIANCAFCTARVAAKRRLGTLLAEPVEAPAELRSPAFLDRVRAQIVEQCEASPLGSMLDRAMPVEAPASLERAFPADLLDSELAGRDTPARAPVGEAAWSRVRAQVWCEVAADRVRRPRRLGVIAVAGVAAAAILCALLVSEGTKKATTIVITDVSTVPALEFSPMAILRRGADR